MCKEMYDITEGDLNPEFLFTCVSTRTEEEQNYHAHDFIEFAVIMGGKGKFYIDGKDYEVEEGDFILLKSQNMWFRITGRILKRRIEGMLYCIFGSFF